MIIPSRLKDAFPNLPPGHWSFFGLALSDPPSFKIITQEEKDNHIQAVKYNCFFQLNVKGCDGVSQKFGELMNDTCEVYMYIERSRNEDPFEH